jgi:tetratricopeptide (TPR) repeat protein
VVVVALAVTIAIPRLTSDADLRVLRAAAQDLSTYLPEQLVLPEGESSADRVETSVLRSGSAQPSSPVSNAVRRLAARAPGSIEQRAEAALWLGIGYLALDDLTSARIQLDAALEESPERVELLNLAAIRAYRAGELALAEGLLRRALAAHPGNALSQLNLGIVLPGEGRREEAAALLRDVESRKLGALSARARLVLGEITAAR